MQEPNIKFAVYGLVRLRMELKCNDYSPARSDSADAKCKRRSGGTVAEGPAGSLKRSTEPRCEHSLQFYKPKICQKRVE